MKILIAPDSFKESMTALEAAKSIERGFKEVCGEDMETDIIPMADGGEGTIRSLVDALDGTIYHKKVMGPDGDPVDATYAILGDQKTAVVEMAESSGIELLPKGKRNPLKTTTFGVGELIKAALDQRVKKIIIGIGGSATNDGGAGMIQALGGKLLDADEKELGLGGESLSQLDRIDLSHLDKRLAHVQVITACDVNNPLTGPNGASVVYGPQKGADERMVRTLEHALQRYSRIIQEQMGIDVEKIQGAGAAGGLGAGLAAFLHAVLEPGIDIILRETRFEERVKDADLIITGEGKIDKQTIYGKTPMGVAKTASSFCGAPVIALCGQLGEGYQEVFSYGITAAFSIMPGPMDVNSAIANGPKYMENLSRNIAAIWLSSGAWHDPVVVEGNPLT